VIGLTATPWRSDSSETASLREFFGHHLMRPDSLGDRPIAALQSRGILARVRAEKLEIVGTPPMTAAQRSRFEQYHDLPLDYVRQLGEEESRNASILARLVALPVSSRVLVFACSVEHAEILTMALNRLRGERCAALVTGETPRAERAAVIDRFRRGRELQFLCNVGVLTTGFDAPKVDVVCVTRPTTSAILYEQMVGRGLRGPQNGGTESCLVLDVQDEGLPDGIQSYARVMSLWDGES
jgi:superfamily II DNA or RNA helicase